MGIGCLRDLVNKNIKLRLCDLNSDSLVNDQFLREIRFSMTLMLAKYRFARLISRFL